MAADHEIFSKQPFLSAKYFPRNELLNQPNHQVLNQFILDCTFLNLPMNVRIPPNHEHISHIMQMCCHLCYGIHQERLRKLKELGLLHGK